MASAITYTKPDQEPEFEDENPLKGVLEWERKSKLRMRFDDVQFKPIAEYDHRDVERTGLRVIVNGREAGEVLFDPANQKWFHVETDADEKKFREGLSKNFEEAVKALLHSRWAEEFEEASR